MSYQTVGDVKGASDSEGKLKALQLPLLTGKKVLDLGCNSGFFCEAAQDKGAASVLGIDIHSTFIEEAKQRVRGHNLNYVNTSWNNLPNAKFDVILFLSALHYEKNPIAFFDNVYSHLADDGLLVIECGIDTFHFHKNSITKQTRHDGERFYPDIDTLLNVWLKKFSCRLIGGSVNQAGDNVPRYVIHCKKKKSTVIFITGNPGDGKTSLAKSIKPDVYISTDLLFGEEFRDTDNIQLRWEQRNGTEKKYIDTLLAAIRLNEGADVIVVDGYILKDLYVHLKNALEPMYRTWHLQR